MSQDHKPTRIEIQESAGYVKLPVNQAQFKNFINSLLGSPQAIVKYYTGSYICDNQTIKEIFQLFETRITMQQHGSYLAKFYGVITLEDGSEIEFNGTEQMFTYNHIGNEICTGLSMTIQYIINTKEDNPEKQSIYINFSAPNKLSNKSESSSLVKSPYYTGVELRVESTDRTWANDIVGLFGAYIAPRIRDIPTAAKITNNFAPETVRLVSLILMIYPVLKATLYSFNRNAPDYASLLGKTDIASLSNKIDILLIEKTRESSTFSNAGTLIYTVIGFGLFAFATFFKDRFDSIFKYRNYAYILFSKASENNMLIKQKENSKGKFHIINAIIVALFLGVMGNVIYDFIKSRL